MFRHENGKTLGRDLKISGFIELGSLCLYAEWGYPTVNMPSAHCMITGSILDKLVSEADDEWGKPWDEISKPMRVYAIANVKHRRIVWDVLVGCILWSLYPIPHTDCLVVCPWLTSPGRRAATTTSCT